MSSDVRNDLVFGIEDMGLSKLRERYVAAIEALEAANGYLDQYRAEAERLRWENSDLKHELQKARMRLDLALVSAAVKSHTNPQSIAD